MPPSDPHLQFDIVAPDSAFVRREQWVGGFLLIAAVGGFLLLLGGSLLRAGWVAAAGGLALLLAWALAAGHTAWQKRWLRTAHPFHEAAGYIQFAPAAIGIAGEWFTPADFTQIEVDWLSYRGGRWHGAPATGADNQVMFIHRDGRTLKQRFAVNSRPDLVTPTRLLPGAAAHTRLLFRYFK